MDASFYFPLLLGRPDIAGHRDDFEGSQKIQESIVETDHPPTTFRDRGQHIIDDNLFRRCAEKPEGIQKTLMEDLLPLAMSELDIEHPL